MPPRSDHHRPFPSGCTSEQTGKYSHRELLNGLVAARRASFLGKKLYRVCLCCGRRWVKRGSHALPAHATQHPVECSGIRPSPPLFLALENSVWAGAALPTASNRSLRMLSQAGCFLPHFSRVPVSFTGTEAGQEDAGLTRDGRIMEPRARDSPSHVFADLFLNPKQSENAPPPWCPGMRRRRLCWFRNCRRLDGKEAI